MYRGGRRPLDLYWRVHSGINGVTMPASISTLTPEEVWDVVNFLQVLPYPKMREKYGITLEGAK
jgi:mono/diheme cytochrome c family protein